MVKSGQIQAWPMLRLSDMFLRNPIAISLVDIRGSDPIVPRVYIDRPSRTCVQLDMLDCSWECRQSGFFFHRNCRTDPGSMKTIIGALLALVSTLFRSRITLQREIVVW